jgi:hypothetical protein
MVSPVLQQHGLVACQVNTVRVAPAQRKETTPPANIGNHFGAPVLISMGVAMDGPMECVDWVVIFQNETVTS